MKMHLKYLRYVLRHKWFVFVECCKLGIPWRGIVHDMSKFRPREWFPYARYFYGTWEKRSERERLHMSLGVSVRYQEDVKHDFNVAWLHHQKRNDHHWQYWILVWDHGGQEILSMPDKCRREMLADWRGAGRAAREPDTQGWYLSHRKDIQLHPDTRTWIESQLTVFTQEE